MGQATQHILALMQSASQDQDTEPTCAVVRGGETQEVRQGVCYFTGIAAESVGAQGICMHLVTIPRGASSSGRKVSSCASGVRRCVTTCTSSPA